MKLVMAFCFAATLGFAVGYWHWGRQMLRGQKPEASQKDFTNRLNVCFYPALLTSAGLQARKLFLICMAGVPLSILLGLIFGGVFPLW
jgi:hypothetical protein